MNPKIKELRRILFIQDETEDQILEAAILQIRYLENELYEIKLRIDNGDWKCWDD